MACCLSSVLYFWPPPFSHVLLVNPLYLRFLPEFPFLFGILDYPLPRYWAFSFSLNQSEGAKEGKVKQQQHIFILYSFKYPTTDYWVCAQYVKRRHQCWTPKKNPLQDAINIMLNYLLHRSTFSNKKAFSKYTFAFSAYRAFVKTTTHWFTEFFVPLHGTLHSIASDE